MAKAPQREADTTVEKLLKLRDSLPLVHSVPIVTRGDIPCAIVQGATPWVIIVTAPEMEPSSYRFLSRYERRPDGKGFNKSFSKNLRSAVVFYDYLQARRICNRMTTFSWGRQYLWPVPMPAANALTNGRTSWPTAHRGSGFPRPTKEGDQQGQWYDARDEMLRAMRRYDELVSAGADPDGDERNECAQAEEALRAAIARLWTWRVSARLPHQGFDEYIRGVLNADDDSYTEVED